MVTNFQHSSDPPDVFGRSNNIGHELTSSFLDGGSPDFALFSDYDQESVLRFIKPDRLQALYSAIQKGLNDLMETFAFDSPDLYGWTSPRSRATLAHDFICRRIAETFSDTDGARLHKTKGFLILLLDDMLAIRFKKFTSHGTVSYINTRQANLFFGQMQLPLLPPVIHLVAGYSLDRGGLALDAIRVACPMGKHMQWSHKIEPVVEFTASPVAPSATDTVRTIMNQPPTFKVKAKTSLGTKGKKEVK